MCRSKIPFFFLTLIDSKTKHAKLAKEHLVQVCDMLAEKDQSLAKVAKVAVPLEPSKKRKADAPSASGGDATTAAAKKRKVLTISEREDQAMESLATFLEDKGGSKQSIQNFRCRVQKQNQHAGGSKRYDTNYYNEHGRRFRSMMEVARHLGLVAPQAKRSAAGMKQVGLKKRNKNTSRETEAEKKRLRKELEKLRKQHTKATKALDDFLTDDKEARYPIEDTILQEEEEATTGRPSKILPTNCAAARVPDVDRFEGLPQHCIPDVLVAWDFLCTFTRAISVNPVSLEDFVSCLTYKPPKNLSDSDFLNSPPVYLGEAHLGLLKLLLADKTSDDWWWSILETPISENAVAENADTADQGESDLPLIKVDIAALLGAVEDPLITTSWLTALQGVPNQKASNADAIRSSIKTAMGVVANKWVLAYLRKALKLGNTSGPAFMKRAVVWLLDRMRDARPDLVNASVTKDAVFKQRAKVVEEVSQQMDQLSSAALAVNDDDLLSDAEDSDDDESDDESDVEEDDKEEAEEEKVEKDSSATTTEPDDRPSSYIPLKPPPTLVDLLLPPNKPAPPSELLHPASWPHLAGAAACRIFHRYTRLRNEVDDSLRESRELSQLAVKERRAREAIAKNRLFTEFAVDYEGKEPLQSAISHLCSGGSYLDLTPLERLCILRILIDASYDTLRVHEVVATNHKQRTSAVKALETEQRKFKREAKEKNAANEATARQDLALEAKRNFIEGKREEIRKANEANNELTNDEIDELTEEDILDFDDDIKADFEALPAPESFKKAEVVARVAKILEAAAFETELLTVLSMEEILEREKAYVTSLEENLNALGGEDALLDPETDRDTVRAIEKLRRELAKIQAAAETLPSQREVAIESLKDAIADGTIKSLRAAIRVSKTARLFGKDDDTNGVWALDVVRDAHMELENAKQLKRVADAQKDLVSKLNKCFIRTEPLGCDRFRNRFWRFENSEQGHVWVEVDYVLKETTTKLRNEPGSLQLVASVDQVAVGSPDIEEDFFPKETLENLDEFRLFSRREYHQSGVSACFTTRAWGCQVNEASVRALTKGLDSRGMREDNLKKNLKEALEEKNTTNENAAQAAKEAAVDTAEDAETESAFELSGDETRFAEAKRSAEGNQSDMIDLSLVNPLSSGIGQDVRVRTVVERTKDSEVARYEVGTSSGWKIRKDEVAVEPEGDEFEPQMQTVETAVWRVLTKKGNEVWLTGAELLESICRFQKWKRKEESYFEPDAAFLSYRNGMGRHVGRAAEAGHAMTPIRFTQMMVKREAEIYQKIKHHAFENTWGGKNGSRNAWITSMRDFAFDFETAREGLLTFEKALLELTGGFGDDSDVDNSRSGRELLENPTTREDIELESLEKGINGLWNSRESRNVFLEIVKSTLLCLL
eukprot:scaffold5048_cov121-Cylindrotheca_fusiformis.AAC.3